MDRFTANAADNNNYQNPNVQLGPEPLPPLPPSVASVCPPTTASAKENLSVKLGPPQNPPVTDIANVLQEWNWDPSDQDIDRDDLDSMIERCNTRIETGILPEIWQRKLEDVVAQKELKDAIQRAEPELPFETALRVHTLREMQEMIESKNDPYDQLDNLKSIIFAYINGHMQWNSGANEASFWFRGQCISSPENFDLDDYYTIARRLRAETSFWVEGLNEAGPAPMCAVTETRTNPYDITFAPQYSHWIDFEIRIPGTERSMKLEFFEDSGSAFPTIWTDDISNLITLNGNGTIVPSFSHVLYSTLSAQDEAPTVILEMKVAGNPPTRTWFPLQVMVKPMNEKTNFKHRLSGKWWRYAVLNEQSRGLHAGNTLDDIFF